MLGDSSRRAPEASELPGLPATTPWVIFTHNVENLFLVYF
jgi:hypothetical protein